MAKASKRDAQYQGQPNGADHCSLCTMFQPPESCTDVEGRISPRGWCIKFYPKAKQNADARS